MAKNKNTLRLKDPYLDREKSKYPSPLPSREWIHEVLKLAGVPINKRELAKQLSILPDEYNFFENRLYAMVRDGQLYINRRGAVCIADKLDLVKCRIEGHKDGYGFAIPLVADKQQADFALSAKQMRNLMHGDTVMIRPTGTDRRGRPEGRIVEILERAHTELVARIHVDDNLFVAIPEDKKINQSFIIIQKNKLNIQSGQIAVIKIDRYPDGITPATAHIKEILGDFADAGLEIDIAVRKHNLPYIFSNECLKEAEKLPELPLASDYKNRVDLRHLPLVTIDGESARDFDDAVYAEKHGRNFRLIVAIADVSHYVKPDSALDKDALERGTSVYFPRRVIPMLPEKLSNGLCSLNPQVDRLCMVCDMQITYAGNIKEYSFYPAVMNSHARLSYDQVWDFISNNSQHERKKEIDTLYALYQVLLKKREKRGALEFDSQETQMIFDDNGKISSIVPVIRNDAHRLIEECMLCANVCAAEFMHENKHEALYRSHEQPKLEKLNVLKEQLALLGLNLISGDNITPQSFAQLFTAIEDRPDKSLIQKMLLRSMQQANYQTLNKGHFGLAYDAYTHFTSPIRRYPDLTVHRVIKAILQGKKYLPKSWQELGIHCSSTERRAEEASRGVESWLKTFYMRDKIGEVFDGIISGTTNFGLFVTLNNIYVDGMVHISDLGQDYFIYRPEILAVEGERTKLRFSMGDPVVVKIIKADLDSCRIDLSLISGGSKHSSSKSTDKKPKIDKSVKKANKAKTPASKKKVPLAKAKKKAQTTRRKGSATAVKSKVPTTRGKRAK